MAAISAPLKGRPYKVDAIGEGVPPDTDPPARYDVFDCLTFVEEVLALALPADPTEAPSVRASLRYGGDGPVAYENRNHFMLTQWVPRNVANGWLEDITETLGAAHQLEKDITLDTWRYWKRRRLFALTDDQLPVGHFSMPVLSLDEAVAAAERVPDGAIVLTVRTSRPGVPIVVTHLGFTVPSEGVALMRHATRMGTEPRVRDDRLGWYADHLRAYDKWPVEGLTVLMPREPGPRVSRVPSGG